MMSSIQKIPLNFDFDLWKSIEKYIEQDELDGEKQEDNCLDKQLNDELDLKYVFGKNSTIEDILIDVLKTLKIITDSHGYHLYLTKGDKIYRVIQSHCKSYPTKWKIRTGSIVAAHVAATKEFWYTNKGINLNKFRYGVGRNGKDPEIMMCIPLIGIKNDNVMGVFELNRKDTGPPYTLDEIDMAVVLSSWVATTVSRKGYKTSLLDSDECMSKADEIFFHYIEESISFTSFICHIMVHMRDSVNGENVSYSELVNERSATVIDFTEHPKHKDLLVRSKKRRKLNLIDDDAALRALKSGETERKSDETYQSLICPVFSAEKPVGVIELKVAKPYGFSWQDELLMRDILNYVSIAYNFHHAAIDLIKRMHMTSALHDMVLYELRPCKHDQAFIVELFKTPYKATLPNDFFSFSWFPKECDLVDNLTLIKYTFRMFHVVLGSKFIIENPKFGEFLIMVKRNYRDVPYHNFTHAFITTHSMFCLLMLSVDKFYYLEVVALMVSALCHDLDHPGVSNGFLKLTDNYLSRLYEGSILEGHHCFMAKTLISHCMLFNNLTTDDYNLLMGYIDDLILATDLTNHFKVRARIMEVITQTGFNWTDSTHRDYLKSLMMTSCDLASSYKKPDDSKGIIVNLFKEFYNQGDKEMDLGVVPLALMDRNRQDSIPIDQAAFLNLVSIPCFEILKEIISNSSELYNNSCELRDYWLKRAEETPPRKDLIID